MIRMSEKEKRITLLNSLSQINQDIFMSHEKAEKNYK